MSLTASPAQAASGSGPYYAEPAWDRILPTGTRFVILTNWNKEAVLDKETGLVWERTPSSPAWPWSYARFACTLLTIGNRKGWHLPSVHELASLVDPSAGNPGPTLPPGHPFIGIQPVGYWSATTYADDPATAWIVFFIDGSENYSPKANNPLQVWCVRGGNNAEAY